MCMCGFLLFVMHNWLCLYPFRAHLLCFLVYTCHLHDVRNFLCGSGWLAAHVLNDEEQVIEAALASVFILHPSSFILHPSSFFSSSFVLVLASCLFFFMGVHFLFPFFLFPSFSSHCCMCLFLSIACVCVPIVHVFLSCQTWLQVNGVVHSSSLLFLISSLSYLVLCLLCCGRYAIPCLVNLYVHMCICIYVHMCIWYTCMHVICVYVYMCIFNESSSA